MALYLWLIWSVELVGLGGPKTGVSARVVNINLRRDGHFNELYY